MNAPLCDRFRSRFDDYHDGLLPAELSHAVRSHLEACDRCREEYGLLVSCIGVIRGLEAPAVPPQTLRRIADSLLDPSGNPPFADQSPGSDLERGLEPS